MKKIFCLVIIITILIIHIVPCDATDVLSKEEAGTLINKAVGLYDDIRLGPPLKVVNWDISIDVDVHFYRYDNDEFVSGYTKYYLVIDESKLPSGGYETLSEYAKSIYTADIAESMYNTLAISYYSLEFPMFYKSESGELYMHHDIGYDWTEVAPWYYGLNKYKNQFTVDNIDIVYADNEKATVRYLTRIGRDEGLHYGWVECYLVNTDDGWRITDSPFTKMLRYERYAKELWEPYVIRYEDYKESPSTADPAFDSFVILPVISLACLVPAVCLLRRRRRTVA